ncbi:hypothetical protein [Dongia mobilis]|jgi:hypothetical protein|uniref:hypothetical protein n=1 Tax=Dongia sp. TaxID=1977262 RepID=UPI0026F2F65A
MIYKVKLGWVDPDLPAGERWFARQIEGRYGQFPDDKLPAEWLMLLRQMDKVTPSGA